MTDLSVFGEEVTATMLTANELNDHINHVYMQDFDFETSNERAYESLQEYTVSTELDDYDETELKDYLLTGAFNNDITNILLNDMCRQDIIEEGYYIIKHEGH